MPDRAPNIDIKPGDGGRLVYDKTRRTIVAVPSAEQLTQAKQIELLTDLLLRWVNIAENGKFGERTKTPLKRHPIVAETLAAVTRS